MKENIKENIKNDRGKYEDGTQAKQGGLISNFLVSVSILIYIAKEISLLGFRRKAKM